MIDQKICVLGYGTIAKKIEKFSKIYNLDITFLSQRNIRKKNIINLNKFKKNLKNYDTLINLLKFEEKNKYFLRKKLFSKMKNDINLIHQLGFSYSGVFPSDRLSSFFGKELILGSYISRLFPFFLLFLITQYNNKQTLVKILLIIIFSISFFIVYLSGERSAFFYMIINLFIFLAIIKFNNIIKVAIVFLILFSIIIGSFAHQDTFKRVFIKTFNQMNIAANDLRIFSIQHEVVYISAFRIFKDNLLLGIGPKMFREICKKPKYQVLTDLDNSINGCQTHPHNTYLQLLSETGIIGTIPVVLIFIYSFYITIIKNFLYLSKKTKPISDKEIVLMSCIFINLWPFVPTGNFFNNWISIIYFLPIGFLLYERYKK